eukprot:1177189-Prorocentrum_minimum.AAC.2
MARSAMLNGNKDLEAKILAFKAKPPAPPAGMENNNSMYSQNGGKVVSRKQYRHIPQAPERILDAPELLDDYYLNLLDWSSKNVVAIALGPSLYLWNSSSGDVSELMSVNADADDLVTSVQWGADGKHIAIGTNNSEVQIWDAEASKQVRCLKGHAARVSAMSWNNHMLATAGRDTNILMHDVRIRDHLTARLESHEQEVCGLKWSPNGQQLASGGNDNLLHIWDMNSISNQTYLHRLDQHQAAVKALAWCPWSGNLLASGGGTADRTIKFWNTHTGAMLNSIDTHSQVCALQWNRHEREILSSHGFSQNQLCVWKYPSMAKMAELTGHTARVLHMAQSPDGYSVVSAAADETLRFWNVFGQPEVVAARERSRSSEKSVLKSINISDLLSERVTILAFNGQAVIHHKKLHQVHEPRSSPLRRHYCEACSRSGEPTAMSGSSALHQIVNPSDPSRKTKLADLSFSPWRGARNQLQSY